MTKYKYFIILFISLLTNFCSNNLTLAIENVPLAPKYPDYSYEFVGYDKYENLNRKIFIFNLKLNNYLIRPINTVYTSILPKYALNRVQNVFTNMEFPIRYVSCLLQKDVKASKTEAVRFLTNTTLGVGGLYDPAKNHFKIEPVREDMAQALAHSKIKRGPFLFLPIITPGTVRDHFGTLLDVPLNPTSYIFGPIVAGVKAISLLNKASNLQSLIKTIDSTYADPYDITKKLASVDRYIKNENLDREDVLEKLKATQKTVKVNDISNVPNNSDINTDPKISLKADIELNNYNAQNPLIDALRTAFFNDNSIDASKWAEPSIWNKSFAKKIKTSSVSVYPNRPNYKYRYILQKNKMAPLAIIYPSIGENINSHHAKVMAKIFYDQGYSVLIQGSPFQWEFVKSMPDYYRPGLPSQDANYLRVVTGKIIDDLENKKGYKFNDKILVGTSFGAMTTLFVAQQEEINKVLSEKTLGISNYISINPPVEIFFALKQIDKCSQDWKNDPTDLKLRVAITAQKVIEEAQKISAKKPENGIEETNKTLPFSNDEAGLITGFIMKQKLNDVIFTIEKGSKSKKSDIYELINNMSFSDYSQKYLQESLTTAAQSNEELIYNASLYRLSDFLQKNKNYKIYHAVDDYYVTQEQLAWLKNQSNEKVVLFSNGSHLGYLYRQEFLDEFIKDIKLPNPNNLPLNEL